MTPCEYDLGHIDYRIISLIYWGKKTKNVRSPY